MRYVAVREECILESMRVTESWIFDEGVGPEVVVRDWK